MEFSGGRHRSVRRFSALGFLAVFVLAGSSSCRNEPKTIVVADQYGLAYAPVVAARLQGWFRQEMPDWTIRWETVSNAASVREAVLAGRMDGGLMGIPPYLIGRDRGMEWTATAAVAAARVGMTTVLSEPVDLAGLPDSVRIALPQPGSVQHILLAMAAQAELGDSRYFDHRIVSMSHPDGMNALLSGTEIGAHFTAPPYLEMELATGRARLILDGRDAFGGDFTFIVAVFADRFIEEHPDTVEAFGRVIEHASRWIAENPRDAADLMADHYRMDPAGLNALLTSGSLSYGGPVLGMDRFRDFMSEQGYLRNEVQNDVTPDN